jgi:peroxin-12
MEFLSDVGGGEDRHRPSFFELAAQGESLQAVAGEQADASPVCTEQLRELLAPVVRYVLSVSPVKR